MEPSMQPITTVSSSCPNESRVQRRWCIDAPPAAGWTTTTPRHCDGLRQSHTRIVPSNADVRIFRSSDWSPATASTCPASCATCRPLRTSQMRTEASVAPVRSEECPASTHHTLPPCCSRVVRHCAVSMSQHLTRPSSAPVQTFLGSLSWNERPHTCPRCPISVCSHRPRQLHTLQVPSKEVLTILFASAFNVTTAPEWPVRTLPHVPRFTSHTLMSPSAPPESTVDWSSVRNTPSTMRFPEELHAKVF
mmetsp:Transcript_55905/g.127853  ORF Transcript_55905/g.127853 Transcript_55905/m.127853 type:complete len:249 (-) Transcript_55905:422-1168(-)